MTDRNAERVILPHGSTPTYLGTVPPASHGWTDPPTWHYLDADDFIKERTMPKTDRHDELVALLTEIRDRLPDFQPADLTEEPPAGSKVVDAFGSVWANQRERWERWEGGADGDWMTWEWWTGVRKSAPLRLATIADLARVGIVQPAPADDLPGEPVEPGDLRAGDRVAYTYRGKRREGVVAVTTRRRQPITTLEHAGLLVTFEGSWAGGISDVRLIERAPREDEDPDEADEALAGHLATAAKEADGRWTWIEWATVASAARKHIEAEQEDAVAFLSEEVEILTRRVDGYRTEALQYGQAALDRAKERDEWREVAARYEDGRDKWQAKWRESDEARERAEAERDALRERLDALRADVEAWSTDKRDWMHARHRRAILVRDDERAKGEQR